MKDSNMEKSLCNERQKMKHKIIIIVYSVPTFVLGNVLAFSLVFYGNIRNNYHFIRAIFVSSAILYFGEVNNMLSPKI